MCRECELAGRCALGCNAYDDRISHIYAGAARRLTSFQASGLWLDRVYLNQWHCRRGDRTWRRNTFTLWVQRIPRFAPPGVACVLIIVVQVRIVV